MTAKVIATGHIAEPKLGFTPSGKACLELRIAATPQTKNPQTGEWDNIGADLWINATFWEQHAEKYAEILNTGDRVTVEGTLKRETFTRRDGTQGEKMVIHFPRLLGFLPKASNRSQDARTAANTPDPYTQPTNDPWGAPGAGGAPF